MRISFFNAGLAIAAGVGLLNRAEAIHMPINQIEATDFDPMMLAQTEVEAGAEAEAMFFKKFVGFAKDAINTIAPALSTKNKQALGIATNDPDSNSFENKYKGRDKSEDSKSGLSGSMNDRLKAMAENIKKNTKGKSSKKKGHGAEKYMGK